MNCQWEYESTGTLVFQKFFWVLSNSTKKNQLAHFEHHNVNSPCKNSTHYYKPAGHPVKKPLVTRLQQYSFPWYNTWLSLKISHIIIQLTIQ